MAKGTAEKLGLCSGALYRSARNLAIDPEKRNGSSATHEQNVHIEHTVPINVLWKALKYYISRFAAPTDLHEFLIHHSECAGLHKCEEFALDDAGVGRRRSPAFGQEGKRIGDHPFLRYKPLALKDKEFRVFNVVSGEEIDIEKFTFGDHVDTLRAASRTASAHFRGIGIYSLERFNLT